MHKHEQRILEALLNNLHAAGYEPAAIWTEEYYLMAVGYEFCSGREGFSRRKTTDEAAVTCKNCLKALARAKDAMR